MRRGVEASLRAVSKGVFATADLALGSWPGPRILIYHQITDQPLREMDLSPDVFVRHIEWLQSHGRFVELDEALEDPDRRTAANDYVLTFDDGYDGVFEWAFPVLREHGIPFILYVTSQMVENAADDGSTALGWDQVNQMQESGLVTIGAHTHTHPDLRVLPPDQVAEEINVSNELIERKTGVRPRHFAYTKGYWSQSAEPVVVAEYNTAVLGAGPPVSSRTDLHRLSRVPIQRSDGQFFFQRKVRRGMRLEESVRRRIKGYENPHQAANRQT